MDSIPYAGGMDLLIQTAPAADPGQRIVGPIDRLVRQRLAAYSEFFWQKSVRLVDEVPAQELWVLARPDRVMITLDELFAQVLGQTGLYDAVFVRLSRNGPLVRLDLCREPAREVGRSVAASAVWFEAPAAWSGAA